MSGKSQSILLGGAIVGAVVGLSGLIPILGGCLGCIGYIAAGLVATWHFTNENEVTLDGGSGAGMGALAGVVAGVVGGLIGLLLMQLGLTPGPGDIMDMFSGMEGMDPEQLEAMEEQMGGMEDMMSSPAVMIGATLFGIVIGAILGAIGGAIGASMFKKGGAL